MKEEFRNSIKFLDIGFVVQISESMSDYEEYYIIKIIRKHNDLGKYGDLIRFGTIEVERTLRNIMCNASACLPRTQIQYKIFTTSTIGEHKKQQQQRAHDHMSSVRT